VSGRRSPPGQKNVSQNVRGDAKRTVASPYAADRPEQHRAAALDAIHRPTIAALATRAPADGAASSHRTRSRRHAGCPARRSAAGRWPTAKNVAMKSSSHRRSNHRRREHEAAAPRTRRAADTSPRSSRRSRQATPRISASASSTNRNGDGVEQVRPRDAPTANHHAGHRRSEHGRQLEHDLVEAERVGQLLSRGTRWGERLAGGAVEGRCWRRRRARRARTRPDAIDAGERQRRDAVPATSVAADCGDHPARRRAVRARRRDAAQQRARHDRPDPHEADDAEREARGARAARAARRATGSPPAASSIPRTRSAVRNQSRRKLRCWRAENNRLRPREDQHMLPGEIFVDLGQRVAFVLDSSFATFTDILWAGRIGTSASSSRVLEEHETPARLQGLVQPSQHRLRGVELVIDVHHQREIERACGSRGRRRRPARA